jgi:hydrogenase expression/formation protein HypD
LRISTPRVVYREGNRRALEALSEVFEPREYFEWRGLGSIAHSGMKLRNKYSRFDAELIFSVPGLRVADPKACQCGEILKGVKKPWNVRCLEPPVHLKRRLDRAWFHQKARARRITTLAGYRR